MIKLYAAAGQYCLLRYGKEYYSEANYNFVGLEMRQMTWLADNFIVLWHQYHGPLMLKWWSYT